MKTIIYYFTGTGNSLAAARKIASIPGDCEQVPIASLQEGRGNRWLCMTDENARENSLAFFFRWRSLKNGGKLLRENPCRNHMSSGCSIKTGQPESL